MNSEYIPWAQLFVAAVIIIRYYVTAWISPRSFSEEMAFRQNMPQLATLFIMAATFVALSDDPFKATTAYLVLCGMPVIWSPLREDTYFITSDLLRAVPRTVAVIACIVILGWILETPNTGWFEVTCILAVVVTTVSVATVWYLMASTYRHGIRKKSLYFAQSIHDAGLTVACGVLLLP